MREWLVSLQIPGWLREELIGRQVCDCGAPAVALGVFVTGKSINAMWLCAGHAGEVDAGVTVHPAPGVTTMDREALFYALVRAELKRLANRHGPPDPRRWDAQRGRHLPDAQTVVRRTGLKWEEMVREVSFVGSRE